MECNGSQCSTSGTNSSGCESDSCCDEGCEYPSCSNQDMLKFAEIIWHKATIDAMFEVKKERIRSRLEKSFGPTLDKGANPVEYLLIDLTECITTSLVAHATARDVKIDSIESILEWGIGLQGLLQTDKSVNPEYQGINISFKIKSDASDETLEELIDLAKNISSVANTVPRPTPINVSLTN